MKFIPPVISTIVIGFYYWYYDALNIEITIGLSLITIAIILKPWQQKQKDQSISLSQQEKLQTE